MFDRLLRLMSATKHDAAADTAEHPRPPGGGLASAPSRPPTVSDGESIPEHVRQRQDGEVRGFYVEPIFMGPPLLGDGILQALEDHPHAPGRSALGTRNQLASHILSFRPRSVLEIGAHIGSASVVMGAALKRNNYGTLYCLEPGDHYFETLQDFIHMAGVQDFVVPLKMMSTDPRLLEIIPPAIEMIYLDANHSYSHAYADLTLCDRLLTPHGKIFLDDVGHEQSPKMDEEHRGGVRKAVVDFVEGRDDLQVMLHDQLSWLNPCGFGEICKQKTALTP